MNTRLTKKQEEVLQRIGTVCAFDGKEAAFYEMETYCYDGNDLRTINSLINRNILIVKKNKAYVNYACFI